MLSVIIPCYNEEKLVKNSFLEIFKAIKICKIREYEIIFVDDGSKDNSLSIVEKLKKKNKKIKIIKNKRNYGIGYNFFMGISKSKGNYLIQIPADNSHPAKEISKIINLASKEYDIVTTYYTNNAERSFSRNIFTLFYTPLLIHSCVSEFPHYVLPSVFVSPLFYYSISHMSFYALKDQTYIYNAYHKDIRYNYY